MPNQDTPTPSTTSDSVSAGRTALIWVGRLVVAVAGLAAAGVVSVLMAVGIALAVAYPNLPDVAGLADYRPKLPLRVLTTEGQLIGEFGEERRNLTPIKDNKDVFLNFKPATGATIDTNEYSYVLDLIAPCPNTCDKKSPLYNFSKPEEQ